MRALACFKIQHMVLMFATNMQQPYAHGLIIFKNRVNMDDPNLELEK